MLGMAAMLKSVGKAISEAVQTPIRYEIHTRSDFPHTKPKQYTAIQFVEWCFKVNNNAAYHFFGELRESLVYCFCYGLGRGTDVIDIINRIRGVVPHCASPTMASQWSTASAPQFVDCVSYNTTTSSPPFTYMAFEGEISSTDFVTRTNNVEENATPVTINQLVSELSDETN